MHVLLHVRVYLTVCGYTSEFMYGITHVYVCVRACMPVKSACDTRLMYVYTESPDTMIQTYMISHSKFLSDTHQML